MIDPTKYSTADLERFARAPRSRQEAAAIREELRHRGAGRPDTGTLPLPLFGPEAAAAVKMQSTEDVNKLLQ
jgi:hypothetical protein